MLEFFTMKPLDSDTFVDIYRRTKPPWIAQVAVAVLVAAAVVVTASPIKGGLPTLVLAVAFIAVGVVWWFFLRRHGQRGNDYDPLKTDAEAARTPFSWKEEGRFVFLLILSMAPLQFSSVMDSWKFAWSAGALTLVVALWTMFHDTWRPVRYVSPLAIAKAHPEMSLSEPAEWMWGYFYASKLCPRGRQIRSDALTSALAKWSWEPQAALAAVVATGVAQAAPTVAVLRRPHDTQAWSLYAATVATRLLARSAESPRTTPADVLSALAHGPAVAAAVGLVIESVRRTRAGTLRWKGRRLGA